MPPDFLLHNCPIFVGSLAEALPAWLKEHPHSQVFILADEHTKYHCLPYFLKNSGLSGRPFITVVKPGENAKNLHTCEQIWLEMHKASLDRQALVINVGGGVVGDMGGFCAATWKRGVDFIQVPTTLLSMTDAAIGGKTGIDFQEIKNTIGVFQQPEAVFADPVFLHTLPPRELLSGYAEVIKHALIGHSDLELELGENLNTDLPLHAFDWRSILLKSMEVKVRVVQEDPKEKGLRMLLNFGHSIGHALESWFMESEDPLTHGEAVYIGMICESFHAKDPNLKGKVLALGQKTFPHRPIPHTAFAEIWNRMLQDKKNSSGTVRMAVPDETPYTLSIIETNPLMVQQSLNHYNLLDAN